jgi:hypothetical protein
MTEILPSDEIIIMNASAMTNGDSQQTFFAEA